MKIEKRYKNESEWFDKLSHQQVSGIIYGFSIIDDRGERWVINVSVPSDKSKATVWAPAGEGTSFIHEQLKRKSSVFNQTNTENMFYHIISITHIESGRVKRSMCEGLDELPSEIRNSFTIKRFLEVTDKQKFKNKLVVVVNEDDVETMATFFYLEKIKPLIN